MGAEAAERVQCIECQNVVEPFAVFICRGCRRRPLCMEHMDRQYRMCMSCANRVRRKKLNDFKRGEHNAKSFLRFTEFLFIVIAALFATKRFKPELIPPYEWVGFFAKYMAVWIVLTAAGVALAYVFVLIQRSKVKEVEEELNRATVLTVR